MKINQFHSGTAVGDAITNQMLLIQDMLKKEGYESEIYAQHIDDSFEKIIKPIAGYKGDSDGILLIHHSMGHDLFDKLVSLPDKKAIIYHNITPERYFTDEGTKKYIRIGLQQTRDYKKYVDYAIAASNYNRREMIKMGYKNIDVMPVQISLNRFERIGSNESVKNQFKNSKNLLFVGRVVPNKCQDDLIRTFAVYHKFFETASNLLIVGDLSFVPYVKELRALCTELGVEQNVHFLGKVSEYDLKAYYELTDVFLCMSEHEGFGVPLLEAMVMQVPVLAYDSSAISETLSGAGILMSQKNYAFTAGLIDELMKDNALYEAMVSTQNKRIDRLKNTDTKKILLKAIRNMITGERKRHIQMQGPFETSYSLAIVNRKLVEALDNLGHNEVSIYCTEGPGDYEPDIADLADKPHAKRLWEKSGELTYPDVTIRNMFPPRVFDVDGGLNFQAFAWEESRIPRHYIDNFNKYLNGIGTTSEFVTNALIKSGLTIPVKTMGNGVELPENFQELAAYPFKTKKTVRFLHISSAFPRKGIDILLNAYCKAFTASDDVCLVIKTFPNPHNKVEDMLEELKKANKDLPEVELINKDLPMEKLFGLYKSASCYVHVARGEGFGLTVAEAMLAKIPVIVSPNTGMADFCNERTATLIDYTMDYAKTHVADGKSKWACPNEQTLIEKLRKFVFSPEELQTAPKVEEAFLLISHDYTWRKVSERWVQFIDEVEQLQDRPKVAMVSTWNSKCGIAEYTRFQCEAMRNIADFKIYPNYGVKLLKSDETYVSGRLWHSAFEGNLKRLEDSLKKSDCQIVHFQFNFGFFNLIQFSGLIEELYGMKDIVITFHKTKDAEVAGKKVSLRSIKDSLNKCAKLIVHQYDDKVILQEFGVKENLIEIIPHGQIIYKDYGQSTIRKKLNIKSSLVVGSYGFLLPQKGIDENIKAIAKLKSKVPDIMYLICCAFHESVESHKYYTECKALVNKLNLSENVVFITDFLPNDESIVILQACDVMLMTYRPSQESASGAIRFCMASLRPVITTDQDIFNEFKDCTYQISSCESELISASVYKLLDKKISEPYVMKMKQHIERTGWENVGKSIGDVYHRIID